MAKEYLENPERFYLFELEEYLDFIVDVIERINPGVMLDRFINQAPPGWLIAPKWGGIKNYQFVNKLDNLLKKRNTWQGRLFEK
jgi:radical SAM superfamily enzyme